MNRPYYSFFPITGLLYRCCLPCSGPFVSHSHAFIFLGRAKTVMRRWGCLDDAQSVDCDCGEPQTMAHLLSCRLLDEACTADDLATVTEWAKACARKWDKIVWRTRKKKKIFLLTLCGTPPAQHWSSSRPISRAIPSIFISATILSYFRFPFFF